MLPFCMFEVTLGIYDKYLNFTSRKNNFHEVGIEIYIDCGTRNILKKICDEVKEDTFDMSQLRN